MQAESLKADYFMSFSCSAAVILYLLQLKLLFLMASHSHSSKLPDIRKKIMMPYSIYSKHFHVNNLFVLSTNFSTRCIFVDIWKKCFSLTVQLFIDVIFLCNFFYMTDNIHQEITTTKTFWVDFIKVYIFLAAWVNASNSV